MYKDRKGKVGLIKRYDDGVFQGAGQATIHTTNSALECVFQGLILSMQTLGKKDIE